MTPPVVKLPHQPEHFHGEVPMKMLLATLTWDTRFAQQLTVSMKHLPEKLLKPVSDVQR